MARHANQNTEDENISHPSDTASESSIEEREEDERDQSDKQTNSLDLEPFDKYPMPKELLDIHPNETQVRYSYFPIQEFLAQDIINRISLILSQERNNTSEFSQKVPTSLDGFDGFDFRIYTARSVMLRDQTLNRLCQREMACFPEELFNDPYELYREGEKKVKTYQLTKNKKDFTNFKQQAEQNPKILHLVIADEAHWGSDASTEKVDRANAKFVNSWQNDKHGNVIVLQVTATPFNLLSTNTRLPSNTYCANKIRTNELVLVKEYGKRLLCDKIDVTDSVGPKTDLHHVRWSESLKHRLDQGIVVTLQIPQKRSRGSFEQVWLEVRNGKLSKSISLEPSELTIQGKNGIVTVRHEGKILAAISNDSGTSLEFIDETVSEGKDSVGKCTEFNIILEFGEDVFQLSARTLKHKNFLKYSTEEECMIIDRQPAGDYHELGGLKFVQDLHYLMVMGTCKALKLGTLNKKSKRYDSLTFYYNSMRNKKRDEQLIRYDENLANLCDKSQTLKNTKQLDCALASEYAFFILSIEKLRSLMSEVRLYKGDLIPKKTFLTWVREYQQAREERMTAFANKLDEKESNERVDHEHSLKSIFEEVKDALLNLSRSIPSDIYLHLMMNVIHGQELTLGQDCPKMLHKGQLENAFGQCLKESETLNIVNDLIQKQSALKKGLKGKMKIIRATGVKNGNNIYKMLCLARQEAGGTDRNYMFEIIRDYDNFKISDINNEETHDSASPLYRIRQVLQTNNCQHVDDGSRETCHCKKLEYEPQSLNCKNCYHRHKTVRQYSDLENLPCILILVEKGRMGDTFPSSFNTMDLRLHFQESKKPPYFNSVVQELGRLCRYSEIGMPLNEKPYVLIGKQLYRYFNDSLDTSAVYYGYVEKTPSSLDPRLKASGKAAAKSADADNEEKHYNRILLSAEPQIGKTGTYLKVISLLRNKIITQKLKPQTALEECSLSDDELSNDDTDCDDPPVQSLASQDDRDNSDLWLYPSSTLFKDGVLKTEINSQSKYSSIYGPYKHGKVPTNKFPPKYTKKETNTNNKTGKIGNQREYPYRPMTKDHACPTCRVDGMNSHEIEIEIHGQCTSMSIPNSKHYETRVANTLKDNSQKNLVDLHTRNSLLSWIFTPTYGRATTGSVNLCRTMRLPNGTPCEFIHVLVVKPEEYQEYCTNWSTSHAILKLPEKMNGTDVHEGGVGYSRRFIQLFAQRFDLDTIFMIDDNIAMFKEVKEIRTQSDSGEDLFIVEREGHNGKLETKNVTLYRILKHLEIIGSEEPFGFLNRHTPRGDHTISSYTGPLSQYGIVGMIKMRKGSLRVTEPFRQTHVHSLVFVNIKALQAKGVKYRPWPVFEDLNINNDADKEGLHVVKFSRFFMVKRNLKSWLSEMCSYGLDDFNTPDDDLPIAKGWDDKLLRWLRCNMRPHNILPIQKHQGNKGNGYENEVKCLIKKLETHRNQDKHHQQTLITNVGELDEETMKHSILDKISPGEKCNTMVMLASKVMQRMTEMLKDSTYDCKIVSSHNISEYNVPYVLLHIKDAKYECDDNMSYEPVAKDNTEHKGGDVNSTIEIDTKPASLGPECADVNNPTSLHEDFKTLQTSMNFLYEKVKNMEETNTRLKNENAKLKNIEEENTRLKNENAKLRNMEEENTRLKNENAKLKKECRLPAVAQDHIYGCNICGKENIELFFHCSKCEDYDMCVNCMITSGHPHPVVFVCKAKLTQGPSSLSHGQEK